MPEAQCPACGLELQPGTHPVQRHGVCWHFPIQSVLESGQGSNDPSAFVLSPELAQELAVTMANIASGVVLRLPKESTPVGVEQDVASPSAPPRSSPDAAPSAGVDVVEPTAADIERARAAWEQGRQELVREPWMAFAQELANDRERAAAKCEAYAEENRASGDYPEVWAGYELEHLIRKADA